MAAPVVPITLASSVPIPRIAVFTAGPPANPPFNRTPPATVNSANSKMMNGMYSSRKT